MNLSARAAVENNNSNKRNSISRSKQKSPKRWEKLPVYGAWLCASAAGIQDAAAYLSSLVHLAVKMLVWTKFIIALSVVGKSFKRRLGVSKAYSLRETRKGPRSLSLRGPLFCPTSMACQRESGAWAGNLCQGGTEISGTAERVGRGPQKRIGDLRHPGISRCRWKSEISQRRAMPWVFANPFGANRVQSASGFAAFRLCLEGETRRERNSVKCDRL